MKYYTFITWFAIAIWIAPTTMAQDNTSYGVGAGNGGEYNTSYGYNAGNNVTNDFNTFIGASAGFSTTGGRMNDFLGYYAGYFNTTGDNNTFVGFKSGFRNTTADDNVFIGKDAGENNQTGGDNTFVGTRAGKFNTADNNTFIGYYSGYTNSTGTNNTFLGYRSGDSNTTASSNTFVGDYAGQAVTTGGNNTFLGRRAGYSLATGGGNVFLGYYAGYYETGSNKLYIDNSSTSTPLIYGSFSANQLGINTNDIPSGYTLAINGKTITEEVKVELSNTWPDYVFEKDYDLVPLEDLKEYIQENGHLPNIPSANEVATNKGIHLGEMNTKLLEKIEELTLYILEQEQRLLKMEGEIQGLKENNKNR